MILMEGQKGFKCVFHVDEPEKVSLALANVRNLLQYYENRGLDHRTEIVLNSRAVLALRQDAENGPEAASAWKELSGQGVVVAACGNALKGLGVAAESLYPFVRVVPAGVAELVLRQAEGFAYIKP